MVRPIAPRRHPVRRPIWCAPVGILAVLVASPVDGLAHADRPPAPHDLMRAWSVEPAVVLGLLLAAALYARGVAALWRRTGSGRGFGRARVMAFAAGLATLAVALVSPLDALSSALFAAHMVQHLLLVLVAAPLLVLGAPLVPFLWALPPAWRRGLTRWQRRAVPRGVWRGVTQPLVVWVLHAAVLWGWHLPDLYQAALRREAVHVLEHATLIAVALLFWWTLIQPVGRRRLDHGAGVLYLFATALQGIALGGLIAFAGDPWYPAYAASTAAWGLTPLADQQLAGAIMWAPAGMVYAGAALALLAVWLRAAERRVTRADDVVVGGTPADADARAG